MRGCVRVRACVCVRVCKWLWLCVPAHPRFIVPVLLHGRANVSLRQQRTNKSKRMFRYDLKPSNHSVFNRRRFVKRNTPVAVCNSDAVGAVPTGPNSETALRESPVAKTIPQNIYGGFYLGDS